MKRTAVFLLGVALTSAMLLAADQTSNVQAELKEQGFYFGEVDGVSGPALSAALKRYQIRNGLEVTGQPSAETLRALGLWGAAQPPGSSPAPERPATAPSRPAPPEAAPAAPPAAPPTVAKRPTVDLRKGEEVVESDRQVLREQTRRLPTDPSIVPPPADMDRPQARPSARYAEIYAATPFANAPMPLQEQTLRAAQRQLASQGHYRDAIDGDPGPATEEALLSYQRARRLPLTGRLDLETLNSLRLLPGPGSANPVLKPFTAPRGSNRTYRGVWVQ